MPARGKKTKDVLFEPIKIGNIKVKNRLVRSATHEWLCEPDGTPKPQLGGLLESLARGGVGLIITGYAYVNPRGQASKGQNAIYKDDLIPHYKSIVDRVHRHGAAIVMQLVHGGRQSIEGQKKFGEVLAPSFVPLAGYDVKPRAMTVDEIQGTIADFVAAARRAKAAGFDGVQLHVAHGFLLSNFISPYTNRRTDEWGGSLENRVRIIVEILRGIREKVGAGFPVLAKINATDGFLEEGKGLQPGEAADIAKLLAAEGLKAIEVSGGIYDAEVRASQKGILDESLEAYFLDNAARFKAEVDIPVIAVGGFRTKAVMEAALRDGKCDMISLSRPLIREPDLPEKFRTGRSLRAECISCNSCYVETGVRCNYKTPLTEKKQLPVPVETAIKEVDEGTGKKLPMVLVSGPGIISQAKRAVKATAAKAARRRSAMTKRPSLRKLVSRARRMGPLKKRGLGKLKVRRPKLRKALKKGLKRLKRR